MQALDAHRHAAGRSAFNMLLTVAKTSCQFVAECQIQIMGPGANPIGDLVLERVKDEFDPTVCRCTLDD